MGFLFFYVVILSLFVFGLMSPPRWEQVGEIRGWGVYTDLGRLLQLQARPTQSSVDKPKSLLFLLMCRRRVGEDKDNEEDTQRKTIQEYLALSDCE